MTTRHTLQTFGAAVLRARDQRGVWRPRAHAVGCLRVDGASPTIAQQCVDATERVAAHIRSRCLPPLSSSSLHGSGLGPSAH